MFGGYCTVFGFFLSFGRATFPETICFERGLQNLPESAQPIFRKYVLFNALVCCVGVAVKISKADKAVNYYLPLWLQVDWIVTVNHASPY